MSNRGNPGQRGRGGPGGERGGRGRGGGPGGRGGLGGDLSGGRGSPASSEGRGSSYSGGRGGGGRGSPGGFEHRGRGGGGGPPRGFSRGGGPGSGPVIFAADTPANIDPRLTANQDQLIASFNALTVRNERPLRPGFGKLGKPITLRANFFPVRVPKGPVYDYNVDIKPKTEINRLKFRIFQLLELNPLCAPHLGYIAHDRSERLVSARKLPQPLAVQIPFVEEGDTAPRPGATVYTVNITFSQELDTSSLTQYLDGRAEFRDYDPLPLISALNLVLQQHASRTGVRVGKNRYFFPSSAEKISLGTGVEAWKGFFASVRPTYKQLMVNVNVCMTAFYEPGNLAEALMAFSRGSRGGMPTLPKAFAKGIKVTTRHLGYMVKKPLKAVGTTSARNTFFDCQELGGRISVEAYFKRKYKITLKHPTDLPVVDIGSAKKNNYLPAELCEIEAGQPYRGKLNDRETSNMIRYACNPPRQNAESIVNQGLPTLGFAPQALAPVNGFGVTISAEMAVIPARELPAPSLTYKVGNASVREGSWNILDVKFHRGAQVRSWWVLVVRDGQELLQGPDDPNLMGLVKGFANKLTRSGISMPPGMPRLLVTPQLQPAQQDPARTGAIDVIRQTIKNALLAKENQKPSFILVLLSVRDNYIYPGIKRLGDVELGLHTVHMQLNKALGDPKKQDQYFSNVALKVNTKLGGVNHLLDANAMRWLTKMKTMMVGIDVTHPGPTSIEGTPSIAAVVASVDDSFVQFPASMRIQQSKKEMLDELRDMLVERLLVYEKRNRALPDRIFVFRDGVSEGQFDTVLDEELKQIREAFGKFDTKGRNTPYRPKLSIIICGKRHHARFYPTSSANAARNGNTLPGTVVDKGVTGVFDFDFYLQAHSGLQGTVRPTHYTVVYDENRLSADELQQGTNNVSYLYARATKAVSLIPAAYYADLACERGRCYINDFLNDDKTSVSGRGKLDKDAEKARAFNAATTTWGEGVHPDLRDSMFYI